MKKIFLTGGSGFLGRSILAKLSKKYEIYAPTREEGNLVEFDKLKSWMKDKKFDWIINCAVNGGRQHPVGNDALSRHKTRQTKQVEVVPFEGQPQRRECAGSQRTGCN